MSLLVSEVAKVTGVPCRKLRSWAERNIVRPSAQSAGGQRRYTEADVRRVRYLHLLREQKVPPSHAEALLNPLMAQIEADLEQARVVAAANLLSVVLQKR